MQVDAQGALAALPAKAGDDDGAAALVQVHEEPSMLAGKAAEVSSRALLSHRSGRSCQYCLCSVTSIAQCGVDTVTSGAQCGWKTVTSIAQCGSSFTKACYTRRRRRFSVKLTCSTNEVAKSCSVPNTCDVPKSCDVSQAFTDCLASLGSSLGSDGQQAVKYITDTSCTSLTSCKGKVTSGLSAVTKLMQDAFLSDGESAANGLVNGRKNLMQEVNNKGPSTAQAALNFAQPIIDTFKNFMVAGATQMFGPYDVGTLCSPADSGFWYMQPTDCGLFSAMGGEWTPLNAQSKFNSAKQALSTCFGKKGCLGVPTPFWDLKFQGWCMPNEVKIGISYFLGATVFEGSDVDPAAKSAAVQGLRTAVKSVRSVIEAFASSSGIDLLQIAQAVHERRAAAGENASLVEDSAAAASAVDATCGTQGNWGIELEVCFGVSLTAGGATGAFNLCISILSGCKGSTAILPNILFKVGVAMAGTTSAGGAAGSASLAIIFRDSYPTFVSRVAYGASLFITPSVDLNFLGIPLGAGVPISFGIYPTPSVPSTFAFGIAPAVKADALAQLAREVHDITDEASRMADQAGGNGFLVGVAAATHHIGQNAHHLKAHLEAHSTRQHRAHASTMAAHIDKHRSRLMHTAMKRAIPNTKPASELHLDPVDVTVGAGVGFAFCMTPMQCFGQ
eukprot:TRINITY_DN6187_c0_g1_i5.p1 TRINITY_DN6187_c0_g1~~TRINITY_DN6187_c0_g1_i5.p1  ORF type:complete len:759 (+),score=102.40 TRINITY_DN6187_c0_g1_i5:257-2278(+)